MQTEVFLKRSSHSVHLEDHTRQNQTPPSAGSVAATGSGAAAAALAPPAFPAFAAASDALRFAWARWRVKKSFTPPGVSFVSAASASNASPVGVSWLALNAAQTTTAATPD